MIFFNPIDILKINKYDICFITPNLGKGGMERFLSIITREIALQNYKIVIVTLINNDVEYDFSKDIKIIHLNNVWGGNKIRLYFKLLRMLNTIKPNVVVGFSEVFNPLSILAAKLNGIDVFISDRSNPLLKHKLRDRITRSILYPFANGIIAQTELAEKSLLNKKYNNNICIVPNPLFEFTNNEIDPSKKNIITTGRLVKSKNHKEILEIFSKVVKDDWGLIVVGYGPEKDNLQKKADELGITNKVSFVGKQDNIEYWLNKASIFVFTSLSEGFPNALSEAMAAPLATIAYNCPAGVSDLIINNKNGFLIPLGNQEMFIEKLNILINSEELRHSFMKESIKSRQKYRADIIANKLIDFVVGK